MNQELFQKVLSSLASIKEYWNGNPASAVDAIETAIERADNAELNLREWLKQNPDDDEKARRMMEAFRPLAEMKYPAFTLPATIESARFLAATLGPLLCASDNPHDPAALLAAQANHDIRQPFRCTCHNPTVGRAYYRDQATGAHGSMCCACRKTTQTG